MGRKQILAYAGVTFSVIVWGASFIATKVVLREVSPRTVVWLRFGIGVLVLGLANLRRDRLALPNPKDAAYFGLLGFLGITFHQWLQSTGLVSAQASTTAWIVATTPVFMAILGWSVLGEKIRRSQTTGILLAAAGVFLVVSGGDLASLGLGRFGTQGDILILISAGNWAIFSTASRRGLDRFPASWMMLYVMGFGWLFVTIWMLAGGGFSEIGQLGLHGWLGVGFLGVACSGLAYIFWYEALKAISASGAGSFLYLEPLVAIFAAALVLGEPITWASLAGGATILLGVWLVNHPRD